MAAPLRRVATRLADRGGVADEGLTLIELLVVMAIVGVVGGVAVSGLVIGLEQTRHAEARVDALTATQVVVERASRELRSAAVLNDLDAHLADVDVIRDGMRIRFVYEAVGSELIRRREEFHSAAALDDGFDSQSATPDASSQQVLLDRLQDTAVFTFYGGDGTSLDLDGGDEIRDVRRIELSLVRQVGTAAESWGPFTVQTTVWPRNAERLDEL